MYKTFQTFPGELLPSTFPNPDNIREVRGRTELERRGKYIEMLEAEFGRLHLPLVQLVKECLHNVPNERPTTDDLLARLQRMREEVEGEYGGPVKLDMVRVRLAKEVKILNRRIEELTQQQVVIHVVYIDNIMKLSSYRKHMKLRWRIKPENWRT